jgi:DNA-binding transcriptional regulator YiaG
MDAYKAEMSAQMDAFEASLKEMEAEAAGLTGEAKEAMDKEIASLREKLEAAAAKMADLGTASGAAWEDLKAGMDEAMNDLSAAFE